MHHVHVYKNVEIDKHGHVKAAKWSSILVTNGVINPTFSTCTYHGVFLLLQEVVEKFHGLPLNVWDRVLHQFLDNLEQHGLRKQSNHLPQSHKN